MPRIEHEIDAGFDSVDAAVGDDRAVAPYFRIPGLGAQQADGRIPGREIDRW